MHTTGALTDKKCLVQCEIAEEDLQPKRTPGNEICRRALKRDATTICGNAGQLRVVVRLHSEVGQARDGGRSEHQVAHEDIAYSISIAYDKICCPALERDESTTSSDARIVRYAISLLS